MVSEPTFGQVTLGAYKYGNLMQVSRELIDDNGVDLLGYLARRPERGRQRPRRRPDQRHRHHHAPRSRGRRGHRRTGPLGVTGGFGTQSVVGQGFDLVIDTYHAVISPYRALSCAWLMADLSAATVRKTKDADGEYIWQPSVTIGAPGHDPRQAGFIDPYVPGEGHGGEVDPVRRHEPAYFVRFAGGIRFERSDEYAFNTDLVRSVACSAGTGRWWTPRAP